MLLRHARVHADRSVVRLRVVSGVLERLPRRLEKDALLRIDDLGLARAHPEERRVEQLDVRRGSLAHARSSDRRGSPCRSGSHGSSSSSAKWEIVSLPADEVLPELLDVARARKAAGQRDDRDPVAAGRRRLRRTWLSASPWRLSCARALPSVSGRARFVPRRSRRSSLAPLRCRASERTVGYWKSAVIGRSAPTSPRSRS